MMNNTFDTLVISRMHSVGEGDEPEWDWIDFEALSDTMKRELVQVAERVQRRLCLYSVVQDPDDVLMDVLQTLGIRPFDC